MTRAGSFAVTGNPPVQAPFLVPFASRCRVAGFDIVHPFSVAAYNEGASANAKLMDLGRPAPLGLIVGNTRHFWPVFVGALREEPARADAAHPVDEYAEALIAAAAAETLPARYAISWAHVLQPSPVPVQRIAHAAGLAWLSPSHLSVHPKYGPWIAFRAVVVVDADYDAATSTPPPNPCAACAKPCLEALNAAVSASRDASVTSLGWAWPLWTRVRDVCPEGAAHRYDEDQIRYHYAKDRAVLERLARPSRPPATNG